MKVISNTCLLSRKILPKYAGNKKLIQHGANKATIPATKAAAKDTWKRISVSII
jgi:hypothetical protein